MPPTAAPASARRTGLDPLEGLRFPLSAGLVLFHTPLALLLAGNGPLGRALGDLVQFAYVYTGVFILLSGFLLGTVSLDAAGEVRRGRREFWRARFARLYPLFLATHLLALPTLFLGEERFSIAEAGPRVVLALTGMQAWVPAYAGSLNGQAWTMSVLFACFAAFPFVAARIHRLGVRQLRWTLLGCWALTLAGPIAYVLLTPEGMGNAWAHHGSWMRVLHVFPLARAPEFFAGVVLARLRLADPSLRAWRPGPLFAVGVATFGLGYAAQEALPYALLHNGLLAPGAWALVLALVGGTERARLVAPPAPPVTGLAAALGAHLDGAAAAVARFFAHPTMRRLGRATFTLYLIQATPTSAWVYLMAHLEPRLPDIQILWMGLWAVFVGGCIVTAVLVNEYGVEPLTRWLLARSPDVPARASQPLATRADLRVAPAGRSPRAAPLRRSLPPCAPSPVDAPRSGWVRSPSRPSWLPVPAKGALPIYSPRVPAPRSSRPPSAPAPRRRA